MCVHIDCVSAGVVYDDDSVAVVGVGNAVVLVVYVAGMRYNYTTSP